MDDTPPQVKLDKNTLHGIVERAYMEYGYNVIRWKDGSTGIEGATERQTLVTSRIQELILEALGTIEPRKTLTHLARRGKLVCGAPVEGNSYVRGVAWITGRITCPICRANAKSPPGRRISWQT